jgi:maleamate amidohydrolase
MTIDYNEAHRMMAEARAAKEPLGGGERPAVVVVDFQRAFTEHDQCGPATIAALEATARLLAQARASRIPVIYLTVVYDSLDEIDINWRSRGGIEICQRGNKETEVHPLVPMALGDILVEKRHASGFYGTRLHDELQRLNVDTLVLAGTSTSGCVRATAVDGAARSYRILVVEDCVDDFRPVSREASLWDIADRYGDVIRLEEAFGYLSHAGTDVLTGATA